MQACPLPVSISVGNRAFEEERARVSSVPVKCYNFYVVEGMKSVRRLFMLVQPERVGGGGEWWWGGVKGLVGIGRSQNRTG